MVGHKGYLRIGVPLGRKLKTFSFARGYAKYLTK